MNRLIVGVVLVALSGCGSSGSPSSDAPQGSQPGRTLRVPTEYATPAEAIVAAKSGDTVELAAGEYNDSILIDRPGIRLRGVDRNAVVINGRGLKSNGVVVTVSGVTLENFTVLNFNLNGVLVTGMSDGQGGIAKGSDGYARLDPSKFPPLTSFAVRSVTAGNNGLYGIYAFDAHNGVIEDSYASGSADSGIYVGQCERCNVVVRNNVAEYNAVGYEQANASNDVLVVANRWSNNRVGLTLLSDYQEAFVPQRAASIVGNLITNNNQARTPSHADGGFGIGIGIGGGQGNLIQRNRIQGNSEIGVALTTAADVPPKGNKIMANVIQGNGTDVGYYATTRGRGSENCLQGNELDVVVPPAATSWQCPAGHAALTGEKYPSIGAPQGISFRKVTAPAAQPNRPDQGWSAAGAPVINLDDYPLPGPDLLVDRAH